MTSPELLFLKRRRWATVGVTYCLMLIFMMLFLSPLLFSLVSSFKTNPLEYPPSLRTPQLNPLNWGRAAALTGRAGGSRLTGGFAPGKRINFEIQYFVPETLAPELPEAVVPRRRAGSGLAAVRAQVFASDYIRVVSAQEIENRAGEQRNSENISVAGRFVTYSFEIEYWNTSEEAELIRRVPLDVLAQEGQVYVSGTLPPSRLERRGRVASYDNITPGALGYLFYNYFRVFDETKSISTGRNLFGTWFWNSFVVAFWRVVGNIVFASMAGYALARFRFRGRNLLFVLLLGTQVLPAQVTFISNYLLMRDGIFGLSRLFGADTLLNNLSAVVLVGFIESAKVFIMKQFFESLPRELEEAAYIDGAGHIRTFFRVILPASRPAIGTVIILTFQGSWNDFFWPLIVLTTPEDVRTLPIGILYFRQIYGAAGDWGLILSGAMLSALPVVVLFVVFQKYFLEGLSFSGIKG